MHDIGWMGRVVAAAIACVVVGPGRAGAATEGRDSRIAEVVSARIEMQRSLSEWLQGSLAKPALPYRVDPVVQVILRGEVRELQQQEETIGGDVKFGGKTSMKLPGLGYADSGGNANPEVVLRGPGKRTTRTVRQLDMQVVRMVVRLFVDPAMPKDRRELLRDLAADLAGIEPNRGDELHVADLPGASAVTVAPAPTPGGAPVVVPVPAGAPVAVAGAGGLSRDMLLASLTALCVAGILAFGLSRRGAGAVSGGHDEEETERGSIEIADGRVIGGKGPDVAATTAAERAREVGAFAALAEATPRELAEVTSEVDPVVAAAIIDTIGLGDEASRIYYSIVPPAKQLDVGLWLGRSRVIPRTELSQMETAANAALQRVRSRVTVGGANRLAAYLSAAPDDLRQQLMEAVATRDAAMADAARSTMVLFDDIPRVSAKSIRRVITGTDPAVVALALVGATDDVRDTVLNAVSKRLRSMIEGEVDAARERPPRDVEAARRLLERSMLQLHLRGELVTRAA